MIARALEIEGVATLSLTSARSITQSVGAPRALYLDYPLGQTAGRAGDLDEQRQIMEHVCRGFEDIAQPGSIIDLPMRWSEDDTWKDVVMRPQRDHDIEPLEDEHGLAGDQRAPRHDTPQYQLPEDALAADPQCQTCFFLPQD